MIRPQVHQQHCLRNQRLKQQRVPQNYLKKRTQNCEAFPKLCHLKGRKQKESQSLDLQQFLRFVIHHHCCNNNITHDISWHIKAIQKICLKPVVLPAGTETALCSAATTQSTTPTLWLHVRQWSRIAQTNAAAPYFCYPLITNKELHGASC